MQLLYFEVINDYEMSINDFTLVGFVGYMYLKDIQ